MKASELINDLSQLIEDFGDLPVFVEHEENDKPVIHILPDIGFIICKNGSNSYIEYKLNLPDDEQWDLCVSKLDSGCEISPESIRRSYK